LILNKIELRNFRNYARQSSEFSERVNIFSGANAQGKTNLLESIYLLALGKSFRASHDRELVRHECQAFSIQGVFTGDAFPVQPSTITINSDGSRKKVFLNGTPLKRQTDLVGMAKVILFAPEDLQIVKSSPSFRRQFLDIGLAQCSSIYRDDLYRYTAVLTQRNKFLKDQIGKRADKNELAAWNDQLVKYAGRVVQGRCQGMAVLAPIAARYHAMVSNGREQLNVTYKTSLENSSLGYAGQDGQSGDYNYEKYGEALAAKLQELEPAELARGLTLAGPHRDDLLLTIADQGELRVYASQGQARTAALALKMALVELIKEMTGDYPLLLLDDVLSEFDNERKTALLETVMGITQTFITTTDPKRFLDNPDCKMFRVEGGAILE